MASKPKTPAPPAPAAPPPVATSAEADLARRDTLRNAQKRKGMQATLLSGETNADAAAFRSGNTLLGG
ncbi:hypothetical protein OpiT1DRAFT_05427 [Opitutaceae bacterium TAV1]|nr:hypothetical protein OpiT1DRAFT_05427 [Opitutaceae bacterium TAV1]